MWKDPIVEEVRAIRDAYAKQFSYNVEAIYRDLKEQEANNRWEVVSLPPKCIEPKKWQSETQSRRTLHSQADEVDTSRLHGLAQLISRVSPVEWVVLTHLLHSGSERSASCATR